MGFTVLLCFTKESFIHSNEEKVDSPAVSIVLSLDDCLVLFGCVKFCAYWFEISDCIVKGLELSSQLTCERKYLSSKWKVVQKGEKTGQAVFLNDDLHWTALRRGFCLLSMILHCCWPENIQQKRTTRSSGAEQVFAISEILLAT